MSVETLCSFFLPFSLCVSSYGDETSFSGRLHKVILALEAMQLSGIHLELSSLLRPIATSTGPVQVCTLGEV